MQIGWIASLFIYFVIVLIFAFILVPTEGEPSQSKNKSRKYAELLAILLSGISIISVSLDVKLNMNKVESYHNEMRMKATWNFLGSDIRSHKRYFCNFGFIQSELSPTNLDDIISDYASACRIFSEVLEEYLKQEPDGKFDIKKFGLDHIKDVMVEQAVKSLIDLEKGYKEAFKEFKNHRDMSQILSSVSQWLLILAPFFLLLSMAIAIALVWKRK